MENKLETREVNKVIPFDYHGHEVRTITLNGEPWFVAKDSLEILGLDRKAMERLDEDEKGVNSMHTPGGLQEMSIVSEAGLYSLILGSKKPEARPFKRWVTHEVIPTIRKTGGYVNSSSQFVASYFPQLTESQQSILGTMLDESRRMGEQIKHDAPKVLFADSVSGSRTSILIRDMAKLIRQNGKEIGEKRLFQWLRENGYLIKNIGLDYNSPTQRSMDLGLMQVKETTVSSPEGTRVRRTPLITGKGQQYFVRKFLQK